MSNPQFDDLLILERLRAGDPAGAELLYQQLSHAVRVTLIRIVGPQGADELQNEVFLRALAGLPTFRGESSLKHWVLRIAVNCGLKHLRQQRQEAALLTADPLVEDTPEALLLEGEDRRQAREALETLRPQEREILVLREVMGLPYEAIQERMELTSTGTVKSRLHSAREAIRRAWSRLTGRPL
jgi:RNA polymerase sigma-70 factor (ECF subfamily)